jgi:hypothetical protein
MQTSDAADPQQLPASRTVGEGTDLDLKDPLITARLRLDRLQM